MNDSESHEENLDHRDNNSLSPNEFIKVSYSKLPDPENIHCLSVLKNADSFEIIGNVKMSFGQVFLDDAQVKEFLTYVEADRENETFIKQYKGDYKNLSDEYVFIKIDEEPRTSPIDIKTNTKENENVDIKIEISPTYYKSTNPFYEDFINQNSSSSSKLQQTKNVYVSNKEQSFSSSKQTRENLVSNFSSVINQQPIIKSYYTSDITSNNRDDYEIPIEISKEATESESRLRTLSDRYNLNLDSLVSREEQIFEIENKMSNKQTRQKEENIVHKPIENVRDSIKYFNEKSISQTKKSPPQKNTRKIQENVKKDSQSNGFDLIKVS